jgi:hypothetical protein
VDGNQVVESPIRRDIAIICRVAKTSAVTHRCRRLRALLCVPTSGPRASASPRRVYPRLTPRASRAGAGNRDRASFRLGGRLPNAACRLPNAVKPEARAEGIRGASHEHCPSTLGSRLGLRGRGQEIATTLHSVWAAGCRMPVAECREARSAS